MPSTKATGLLTKDIKLSWKASSEGTYAELLDLQECPELGGAADKVDVTTLADGNYRYINGIKDFGDLDFTFLYSKERYKEVQDNLIDKDIFYEVEFPDGVKFDFKGQASSATSAAAVNGALQFTLSITLNSDISVVFPA